MRRGMLLVAALLISHLLCVPAASEIQEAQGLDKLKRRAFTLNASQLKHASPRLRSQLKHAKDKAETVSGQYVLVPQRTHPSQADEEEHDFLAAR